MIAKRVSVTYSGGKVIPSLDKIILEALAITGLKWLGSGMDMTTGVRDHVFDWKEKA